MNETFNYGIDPLTIGKTIAIAAGKTKAVLNDAAIKKIDTSQQYVQEIVRDNRTVYGINTGFGILANTAISEEDTATLQYKILQSHSVGVGNAIPGEVAKIMLVTKMHALAQGFSGVQLETLRRINWHIENNVIPIVPEKGSVGASGDLAPLAHLFLPLIGLGECYYHGERVATQEVFQKEKINPVQLGPKEGLALIKARNLYWLLR
jgi:histidine ammonia-lyase